MHPRGICVHNNVVVVSRHEERSCPQRYAHHRVNIRAYPNAPISILRETKMKERESLREKRTPPKQLRPRPILLAPACVRLLRREEPILVLRPQDAEARAWDARELVLETARRVDVELKVEEFE